MIIWVEEMEKEKAFRSYTLDEERTIAKRDVFSVSLNEKERELLDRFKQETNIPMDSKALKLAAVAGMNVSFLIYGQGILKYLTSKDRTKILD